MNLRKGIELYMKDAESRISPASLNVYNQRIKKLMRYISVMGLTDKSVRHLYKSSKLKELYQMAVKEGRPHNTIANYRDTIIAMGNFFVDEGILEKNPAKRVNPFTHNGVRVRECKPRQPITKEDYLKLLAYTKEKGLDEWNLMVRLGWESGMRLGDVAQLKANSIDLKDRAIKFYPQKTMSSRKYLEIPISDTTLNILKKICHISRNNDDYVFKTVANRYRRGARVDTEFKIIASKSGVQNKTFHCLRHGFVSRLIENDVSAEMIVSITGQNANTMLRYARPKMESKRKVLCL